MTEIWDSPAFWIGFVYCTFPLNFLVYGWNDIVDIDADKVNPRKDSFLFGAQVKQKEVDGLWKALILVQLFCIPFLFYFMGISFLGLMIAFLIINGLYNLPKNGLRSRPPLELLCQVGYLLIAPLSVILNQAPPLPWQTYIYLLFFAWQSHLIGEVMDIEPDRIAGKKTTATVIGMKKTKLMIIAIVAVEVSMLFFVFQTYIFGSMLAIGLIWLLLDLFLIYKTNNYSLSQMKLFSLLSNIVAIVSMAYVWYSGCLLYVNN